MEGIENPPIIGISGGNADSASVRAAMTQIRDAGAIPMFLGNHAKRDALKDIEKLDGLMVMGNNADIDPLRYGQKAGPHTKSETATPEGKARAEYEELLIAAALDKQMPLYTVCGGTQRLNVLLNGDLHQHVPDITGNNGHAQQDFNIAPFIPVQAVAIGAGTTLAAIAEKPQYIYTPAHGQNPQGVVMENSMHHQAVNKVGNGLRVAAKSTDGIVQAIEADPNGYLKNQFILGVQWHPEFGASPLGKKLADRFVSESQKYMEKHPHKQPNFTEVIQENTFSNLPVLKNTPQLKNLIGAGR